MAVATYLGVEKLSHLNADRQAPQALFEAAERGAGGDPEGRNSRSSP